MITFLETSVFNSPAQTLVNTVNTVGVMGKGIAKEFKARFPSMFKEYKALCDNGNINVGNLHLWKSESVWVLNFPTKTTWRKPSQIDYVKSGLQKFVDTYERLGITSVSFPPLGCGNGNLDWRDVRPLMVSYLDRVQIPVYIHDVQVVPSFLPEHHPAAEAPESFDEFYGDLIEALKRQESFATAKRQFALDAEEDMSLVVTIGESKRERIPAEYLHDTWLRLRERVLSVDSFPDERSQRMKSYLFPLIETLPYVSRTRGSRPNKGGRFDAYFIDRRQAAEFGKSTKAASGSSGGEQEWLFP